MEKARHGGWVYIMADRYRGAIYVGVTSDLAARIFQHRTGIGSDLIAPDMVCTGWCGQNAEATYYPV